MDQKTRWTVYPEIDSLAGLKHCLKIFLYGIRLKAAFGRKSKPMHKFVT